jgi:hypothetical protein
VHPSVIDHLTEQLICGSAAYAHQEGVVLSLVETPVPIACASRVSVSNMQWARGGLLTRGSGRYAHTSPAA